MNNRILFGLIGMVGLVALAFSVGRFVGRENTTRSTSSLPSGEIEPKSTRLAMADSDGIDQWTRQEADKLGAPSEKAGATALLSRYPVGRKVLSISNFDIEGSGVNQFWYVKGEASFGLRARCAVATTVKRNTGTHILWEVDIREISQLLAYSKDEAISIEWPETSLALMLVERIVNRFVPLREIREGMSIVDEADPGLKATLTTFYKALRSAGVSLPEGPSPVTIIPKLEPLSGKRLEVEYTDGMGITHIKVLDNETVSEQELAQWAHSATLLMEHYLFPRLNARPGENWDVDVGDIAAIAVGGRATASGVATITLGEEEMRNGEQMSPLTFAENDPWMIRFVQRDGDIRVAFTPKAPKPGWAHVWYSKSSGTLRSGRIVWDVELNQIPDSLLLKGTTHLEAHVKSSYDAINLSAQESSESKASE